MTTIIIRKTEKKEYVGLICMGHAGYAENEPDIVCAAVSVLVINTINAIEKLAGQKPKFFKMKRPDLSGAILKTVRTKNPFF